MHTSRATSIFTFERALSHFSPHTQAAKDEQARYLQVANQIFPHRAEPLVRLAKLALSQPSADRFMSAYTYSKQAISQVCALGTYSHVVALTSVVCCLCSGGGGEELGCQVRVFSCFVCVRGRVLQQAVSQVCALVWGAL